MDEGGGLVGEGEGLLGEADGGGGFEGDAKVEGLTIRDAAEDAAGVVGGEGIGVVMGGAAHAGGVEPVPDFKPFSRGDGEHGGGEEGFEFMVGGVSKSDGEVGGAGDDGAEGIACGEGGVEEGGPEGEIGGAAEFCEGGGNGDVFSCEELGGDGAGGDAGGGFAGGGAASSSGIEMAVLGLIGVGGVARAVEGLIGVGAGVDVADEDGDGGACCAVFIDAGEEFAEVGFGAGGGVGRLSGATPCEGAVDIGGS